MLKHASWILVLFSSIFILKPIHAKECVFYINSSIKRANGTVEVVELYAGCWRQADTIQLDPGDTLNLYGAPSGNCYYGPISGTLIHNNTFSETSYPSIWHLTENGYYEFYCQTELTMVARFFINSAPTVTVDMNVILGGAFDPGAAVMRDDHRNLGLLTYRYPPDIWGGVYFSGWDRWVSDSTVFDDHGFNSIVSWVKLEFRNETDPSICHVITEALLQRDGDVVDVDGSSLITVVLPPGNYFVAVKHYNHLGAMSANSIPLSALPVTIDFTDLSFQTYGVEAQQYKNGMYCLWPGSANKTPVNGTQFPPGPQFVSYSGLYNDRDLILIKIGGTIPTAIYEPPSGSAWLHKNEDVNLDGIVKYVGAGNDRDPILQTIGGLEPTAVRIEQIP